MLIPELSHGLAEFSVFEVEMDLREPEHVGWDLHESPFLALCSAQQSLPPSVRNTQHTSFNQDLLQA